MIVRRMGGVLMGFFSNGAKAMFLGDKVVVERDDQVVELDRADLAEALSRTAGIQVPHPEIPEPRLNDATPDEWDRAARKVYGYNNKD